jgi:Flp pilus assembly protein TadD
MAWNLFKQKGPRKGRNDRKDVEHFLIDAIESFENRDYVEAIKRFQLIAKLYPDHPIAHLILGRAYIELKDFPRAIVALYDHLEVVPDSAEAMIYLGLAYFECNELGLAQARFEEAMKLKVNSVLARENLVITKISAGRLEEAMADLLQLRKERPGDQSLVELVVLALGKMGKWEAAKQYLQQNDGSTTLDGALASIAAESH